jgi:hypothetical protein
MKKTLVLAILAISFTVASTAQTQTSSVNKEYLELIKQLISVTKVEQSTHNLMKSMIASFKTDNQDIPEEFFDELSSRLEKTMMEEMATITAHAYAKHFSESELKELLEFYSTPLGAKLCDKLPEIQQELYQVGAELGQKVAQEFLDELLNYMKI